MKHLLIALLAAPVVSLPAYADEKPQAGGKPQAGAAQSSAMNDGEIRKVDKSASKITIKHGPLAKLDMPPMTMVFQVKDPSLLERVKPGDKVKFDAEKVGGAYVVTKIEAAR